MNLDQSQKALLYKIADCYYEQGLTQQAIARRFGISRIKVSRLLKFARDHQIVKITIMPFQETNAAVEHALEEKFGLDEIVTVVPANGSAQARYEALGTGAAQVLMRSLQGDETVAITWGGTLHHLVESLPAEQFPDLKVVQTLGSLVQPDADINGIELTRRMAQTLGGRPYLLSAPAVVKNRAVRDALMADPQVSAVLDMAAKADIILVGLGTLGPNTVIANNHILTDEETDRLLFKGAVGDIGLQFFDSNGQKIKDAIHERIISLDLARMKKIPRVIAVAGGPSKQAVIRTALANKMVDVLVTDIDSANALLADT
jgi:DNA-binding transcriptional regulator LsrR (DeoR family)